MLQWLFFCTNYITQLCCLLCFFERSKLLVFELNYVARKDNVIDPSARRTFLFPHHCCSHDTSKKVRRKVAVLGILSELKMLRMGFKKRLRAYLVWGQKNSEFDPSHLLATAYLDEKFSTPQSSPHPQLATLQPRLI